MYTTLFAVTIAICNSDNTQKTGGKSMRKLFRYMLLMLMASLLVSCNSVKFNDAENKQVDLQPRNSTEPINSIEPAKTPDANSSNSDKISVWGYYQDWLPYKDEFEKSHPGKTIEFQTIEGNAAEKYLSAIASGTAPDALLLFSDTMGQFNFIEGLENLLQAPYNANNDLHKFADHQLSWTMTFDDKKLLALPLYHSPSVLYYRTDILEQYGFPTDPEELGNFMEDPEKWFGMVKELKKNNKWVFQWSNDTINMVSSGQGFFDKDLNFVRNTDKYEIALDLTRRIKNEGLAISKTIWDAGGQEAIKNGEIVMVQFGCWGEYLLNQWAPETKGKWKVTRLPLGVYSTNGSPALAITSQSKNKELAWEFVKLVVQREREDYESKLNVQSDFLGGQYSNKLYEKLREKTPLVFATPMDAKLFGWWNERIEDFIESNEGDAKTALDNMEQIIKNDYEKDINSIKSSISKK